MSEPTELEPAAPAPDHLHPADPKPGRCEISHRAGEAGRRRRVPPARRCSRRRVLPEDTVINYVFALDDDPANLALKETLKPGDEATIVWANCSSATYLLAEPRQVAAGATEAFRFTFPNPDSGTVVFKLFDTQYGVEGS